MSDKLRFKDENGQDYPEWISYLFKQCFIHEGGTSLEQYVTTDGQYHFISIGNYSTDGRYIDNGQRIDFNSKSKGKILNKNDLVMVLNDKTSSGDLIGSTIIIKENDKYVYNQRSERIKCLDKIKPMFAWHILNSKKFRNEIFSRAQGGTQIYINFPSIENIEMKIPTTEEQQKIADFLSTVDEKIENQKEIVANWEEIKKGLIQKIFSQEIRFKDENGQDYPEWISYLFKQCFIHEGGTSLEQYVTTDGQYHFISIGNYSTDGRYIDNGQRIDFNSKSKGKILNKNDLVMVLNDKTSSGDLIGSTIIIKENDKYVYNQRSERIKCLDKIKPMFAWHILNSKKFRNEIFSRAQGGTQIYINFPSIENIEMKIPTTEEQQKIADFLSTIDDKIKCEKNMLNELTELKKGLLQRIFKEESKTLFKSKDGE